MRILLSQATLPVPSTTHTLEASKDQWFMGRPFMMLGALIDQQADAID
jgi:hypothetical protein